MSDADTKALRRTARRTWRFFETFVTSADNMLPPDNFQDDPTPAIAHRTSPTNLGLYLLSVVSARDFGWIGIDQAIERLEATLATMSGLLRFRGHFYNWYDTAICARSILGTYPSVDSGNLAGHLIALANACREWRDRPFEAQRRLDGVADALDITCAEVRPPARRRPDPDRDPGASSTTRSPWWRSPPRQAPLSDEISPRDSSAPRRRRDHDRYRRRARGRTRRRQRRRHAVLGGSDSDSIDAHREIRAVRGSAAP